MDINKLINHKALVPGLLGASIFSAGVAAGVALERFLESSKATHIPEEENTNTHPQLFDPDNPPAPERMVITLDEALAMREQDRQGGTDDDGDEEPIRWVDDPESDVPLIEQQVNYTREVMAEKTASRVTPADPRPEGPSEDPVPFNVLSSADEVGEEWDWDREMTQREMNPEGPYQIHEEEFAAGAGGFHNGFLLFYGVDQIVCEQNDPRSMMYDHATKLGDIKFGYGATDEDTAYVRNVKERTDYQIVQMHDSYSESVMGIVYESEAEQAELQHMDRPLRMRKLE